MRPSRIAAILVAALGLALIGIAAQGMLALDGRLEAATKHDQRLQRQHTIEVRQHQPPLCPRVQTRAL